MKALVTGAAGFIGSHVVRHCLALGMDVVALDDLSGGFIENVPIGARWINASVTDWGKLQTIFDVEQFDYVYHLAAYAAEGLSHFIRRYNYKNNLLGSINLINLSILHRVKCFVFTSSIAVYGSGKAPFSEEMVPQPEDPYGVSKYAVELDLRAAYKQFGLPYVIFRPHNVYGENQNIGDKYRNVIGILMNQILTGQSLTIFGDGEQTRAFSYIDDVAPVIARSVAVSAAYGETFNVGGDYPCTVNELVRKVGTAMDVKPEVRYLPKRNEAKHAFSLHQKARSFFEMASPVPLEHGLVRMAKWAKEVGSRKTKDFAEIEISRGLPNGW